MARYFQAMHVRCSIFSPLLTLLTGLPSWIVFPARVTTNLATYPIHPSFLHRALAGHLSLDIATIGNGVAIANPTQQLRKELPHLNSRRADNVTIAATNSCSGLKNRDSLHNGRPPYYRMYGQTKRVSPGRHVGTGACIACK